MSLSTISKLEQGRAAKAYEYVQGGAKLSKSKEYKSYLKKLPMLIKTNGLGAAIAFAFSKGSKSEKPNYNEPWGLIYHQIEDWIKHKQMLSLETNQLANALTKVESSTYRAVTNEVLALLNWMRRFADGLIEGESEE